MRNAWRSFGVVTVLVAAAASARAEEPAAAPAPVVEGAPAKANPESPESASREADMFGGGEESKPAESKPNGGGSREDDMFGGDDDTATPATTPDSGTTGVSQLDGSSEARLAQTLLEKNDKLAIGGRFLLQGGYVVLEGTDLEPQESPLFLPSITDIYFDGRPNDSIRFYGRGRLNFSFSENTHDKLTSPVAGSFGSTNANPNVQLEQLWLKFDLAKSVFVTIGKQRIRWGTGRTWNPTDFMNQARLDPLAVADFRLGANLVKVHVPVESLGWNFYALADLQTAATATNPTAALTPAKLGGALRAEMLLGPAEVSLTAYARPVESVRPSGNTVQGWSPRFGADVSLPLGPVDLRVESAFVRDPSAVYFDGEFSLDGLDLGRTDLYALPTRRDRSDDYVPQVVTTLEYQLQYSDEDFISFSGEYFFNDAGYDDGRYYKFFRLAPTLNAQLAANPSFATALGLDADERWSIANGGNGFNGLYYGRHYASFGVSVPQPGPLNDSIFGASLLGNLSDGSWRAQLTFFQTILTNMQVALFTQYNFGEAGEFLGRLKIPGALAGGAPGSTVEFPYARFAVFGFLIVNI